MLRDGTGTKEQRWFQSIYCIDIYIEVFMCLTLILITNFML